MSDRFKFRVWSKAADCYMENPSDVLPVITTDGDFAYKDRATKEFIYFDDEFAVIEQCTGLKDKNGKLIYEGDIVDVQEHIDSVNGYYIVEWSDVCHHWNLRSIFKDSWGADRNFSFSDLNYFNETSEVIGNIHENPDLLEQSDE